jgi:hypothetical protein
MTEAARGTAAGSLALLLGLGALAAPAAPPGDPGPVTVVRRTDRDLAHLLEVDGAQLRDDLGPAQPDDRALRRVRRLALVFAQGASDGVARRDGNVAELAGLRDRALGLFDALDRNDLPAARRHAAGLVPAPAPARRVSLDRVDLAARLEYEDLKMLYAPQRRGGLDMERDMNLFLARPPAGTLAADQAEKFALLGARSALLAELTRGYAGGYLGGPEKKASEWDARAEEMRRAGLEVTQAAAGTDPKPLRAALTRLRASCTNCHDVFRD